VHDDGDMGRVYFSGHIDLETAPTLRARLAKAAATGAQQIVVDLGDVTFMDSTGLAVLIEAQRCFQSTRRTLRIVRASDPVQRLIELADLTTYFDLTNPDEDHQL